MLAIAVRSYNGTKGVAGRNFQTKISLYADDVFLYLQNIAGSLGLLNKLLSVFSQVCGYKVNKKMVMMGLNIDEGEKNTRLLSKAECKQIEV